MWFDDDLSKKKKRRRTSRKGYRPVLVLNSNLKRRRQEWVTKAAIIVAFFVLAAGAAAAVRFGGIKMGQVLFSGNDEYRVTNIVATCSSGNDLLEEFVRDSAGVSVGTNLFLVDIAGIQGKIEATPNIRAVEVFRELPGTLRIHVMERDPVARLGNGRDRSRYLVVDDEGVVFPSRSASGLVELKGYSSRPQKAGDRLTGRISDALVLLKVYEEPEFREGFEIEDIYTEKNRLKVGLVAGPTVSIAWRESPEDVSIEDLKERLVYLKTFLEKARAEGQRVDRIDLTRADYTNRFVASPRWIRR